MCLGRPIDYESLLNPIAGIIREGNLLVVMVVVKRILLLVELVLRLHYGDFHTLGSQLSGWISKG